MEPLIRRMALIVCTAAAFAFGFTAIVQSKQESRLRFHPGTSFACLHPASSFCVAAR